MRELRPHTVFVIIVFEQAERPPGLILGGKSELRRAGRRVTPGGGDSKDSATEIYRPAFNAEQGWKGEVRAHQSHGDLAAM